MAIDLCPTIDFNTLTCGSLGATAVYEINNYSNAKKVIWTVEGGEIIQIGDDYSAQSFGNSFCQSSGYDWQQATTFTSISYDRENNGSATFFDNITQSVKTLSQEGNSNFNYNFAKKITIFWHPFSTVHRITVRGEGLGAVGQCNSSQTTKDIVITPYISSSFTLTASQINSLCNQGVTISGAPANGTNYSWNTNGGVIQNSWNGGINISRFTNDGIVPISVTVSNQCNSVTKTINLNITQPDFGHVTQNNNNVDVPGSLVTLDCQGGFNLNMPTWVSSYAIYTWELPGTDYNSQTNTYTKTIVTGINKQNVQGQLPIDGLTDFVGKVTITGVCGAPVVKTFIIRPALRPTVDPEIYSCTNSVLININNPTAISNVNAWVAYSTPLNLQASITNQTPTSAQFTSAGPGTYYVTIEVYGAGGCNTRLGTVVYTGTAGQTPTTNTSGWQAGVLSDNRKAPGSNIVAYGGNIYFSGRDGKIYYYSFSAASEKWIINEIPGITNALVPASGAFNKIGIVTLGTVGYLFFTNNTGLYKKINLITNVVDDGFVGLVKGTEIISSGSDIFAIESISNVFKTIVAGNVANIATIPNATLKAVIPGNGVAYVQNNNLFITSIGQLTSTADVYASSDVVYYNGWLYYARGQKGTANLYRKLVTSPSSAAEQITTSSNLSGIFNINPASGVIYYGIMNLGNLNTITTQISGTHKAGDVYQARLSGASWILNKATTVVNYEGLDMLIHSAVYSGNHLYYIGAGRNSATGPYVRELEVWNLYYENGCAPAIQRTAQLTDEEEISTELLIYPNPFNAELMIDLSMYSNDSSLTSVAIEVIDAAGKSIYEGTLSSELVSLSTAEWAKGMYIVKIKNNNTVINKKAIKY